MSAERIIPARLAREKIVGSFPYLAATFPTSMDLDGESSIGAALTTPEEDIERLASVDQVIHEKLQKAEHETHDIARRAYEEGFAAGENEGRAFGESQYRVFMQRLEVQFVELSRAATLLHKASEDEILALSLAMGEYLAGRQIELPFQTIRPLLDRVLESHPFPTPTHTENGTALEIFLNPKDMEDLGDTYVGYPGIVLKEDAELSRGSLRLESPEGVVDATLDRRRARILQLLHQIKQKESD